NSPTKNLTQPSTNSDSKNPRSLDSKTRPLLWATNWFQPPPFPSNRPVHLSQVPWKHHRIRSIGGRTALGEAGNTAQGIGRQMCRIIKFNARFAHRFGRRMETAPIGARQLFVLAIALSCDDLRHRRQLRGFLRSRIDERLVTQLGSLVFLER